MGLKDKGFVQLIKRCVSRTPEVRTSTLSASDDALLQVVHRAAHCISRNDISKNALKVLYRLNAEFDAYLVGGSVRDLLLKRAPKDFDVVTDATPEQIRKLFRNSRIIGRRFRLVHVYFNDEVIEVSTFRANTEELDEDMEKSVSVKPAGMVVSDNTYGTIEEDAWRRDFTVNALYYNIKDFSIVDYTGGLADLQQRCIQMIGDPVQRFHEDPVRLLRAIRLAAKLDFQIAPVVEKAIIELSYLLKHVPGSRLLDEMMKLFFEGHAYVTYQRLLNMKYLPILLPSLAQVLTQASDRFTENLIQQTLVSTDKRFASGQRLMPGFLFAVLLWPALQKNLLDYQQKGHRFFSALHLAMQKTIADQAAVFPITKRMLVMMHSIWTLQYHLERRRPLRVYHLLAHRYFRAAFDLLVLRAEAKEVDIQLASWWQKFQTAKPKQRSILLTKLAK